MPGTRLARQNRCWPGGETTAPRANRCCPERPKEPKSRRNPGGFPRIARQTKPGIEMAGHYRFAPDFAEMRQRRGEPHDRSGGHMSRHLRIAPAVGLAIGLTTMAHSAQALDEVTF